MIGIFVPLKDLKAKKGPPIDFLAQNNIKKPEIAQAKDTDVELDENDFEALIDPKLLSKKDF